MAEVARGDDALSKEERALHMSRIRATGNASTEGPVVGWLAEHVDESWVAHPRDVVGRPDFYFPRLRLAVFVDGCFWHGCPTCDRNLPKTRPEFWRTKLGANRARDARVTRELRATGQHVLRIWEHELRDEPRWTRRLRRMLTIGKKSAGGVGAAVRTDKVPSP